MSLRDLNRWKWFWVWFILGCFLSFVILALSSHAKSTDQHNSDWQSCIPDYESGEREKLELIGEAVFEGRVYHFFHSYLIDSPYANDLIISEPISDGDCQIEVWNPMGDRLEYAEFIPVPVAQTLALSEARSVFNEVGRNIFERRLQETVEAGFSANDLFPEEIWALQQLQAEYGFQIPEELLPDKNNG